MKELGSTWGKILCFFSFAGILSGISTLAVVSSLYPLLYEMSLGMQSATLAANDFHSKGMLAGTLQIIIAVLGALLGSFLIAYNAD